MYSNTTGSNNIALGYRAGFSLTTGSSNVDIGNPGVAAESNTIRIGTQGTQTKAFIGGVCGSSVSGDAVVVSSTGQLGIVVSSARYKRDIRDMDAASGNLLKLRPSFSSKSV
jgi:trimeric autotransporter adhesin